jgi:PAS domain S-box-containing protein
MQDFDFNRHPHSVQFYTDDNFLLDTLSRFMGAAVGSGDAGVVIATPEHRLALAMRLRERGLELERAVEQGRYIALDAAETLGRFMTNGWPDEQEFLQVIGGVITRAKAAAQKEHGRAALFGEMVALLWAQGNVEGALRLEELWNQIAQSHSFSLVCAYPLTHFYNEAQTEPFIRICQQHSAVLPAESYSLAPEDERLRLVARWQQRAQALEQELKLQCQLREASARLAAIVESSEDAIVSKDLNGIITSWNASAERIFGWKAEEIIGKSILTIIPPELHKDEDMILSKIRRGERLEHFETVRLHKDGGLIEVSLTVSPMRDESGRVIGAAKIARDVSQRRRAEDALRRAERLAATGQMAASIAHEINNPMQALTNLLSLISQQNLPDAQTRELVAMAENELKRMSYIARQMLSFYREDTRPMPVKISSVLDEMIDRMCQRNRSKHMRVDRRYEFEEAIPAFPVEVRQLFSNLLNNAAEAIEDGGRIVVRLRPSRDRQDPQRHGVRIVIADDGPGIQTGVQDKIFEPFVTTKSEKGTGLGLWVVKAVVARHGGHIRVRSSTRRGRSGTTFSVFLPAGERPVQSTADQLQAA